jgi:hypothetical protein
LAFAIVYVEIALTGHFRVDIKRAIASDKALNGHGDIFVFLAGEDGLRA